MKGGDGRIFWKLPGQLAQSMMCNGRNKTSCPTMVAGEQNAGGCSLIPTCSPHHIPAQYISQWSGFWDLDAAVSCPGSH